MTAQRGLDELGGHTVSECIQQSESEKKDEQGKNGGTLSGYLEVNFCDFWEKRIGEKELEQKLERKMRGK